MQNIISRERAIDLTVLLLRVFAGYMFLQVGGLKLFGWFGGMPEGYTLSALIATAGWLEVVGGSAIILGLFARPVAFILAGEMAVAYFLGHVIPNGHMFVPLMNQGDGAVLFCFIFLFIAAYGAGKWSLDRAWRKVS